MGPDSLKYQKSIALEFNATKDRIRYLIGSSHWGEDGRHKEVILMNFLKRFLPTNIDVGTGFIKKGNRISTQIDIIIFDPSFPMYFKENDFVIVQPESVLGIIEVKSNPDKNKIAEAVFKASKSGEIVKSHSVFNGLFIFGKSNSEENRNSSLLKSPREGEFKKSLSDALTKRNGLNHIVSNDGVFIKKWPGKNFSCYSIDELASSYFFSNLLDAISERSESLVAIPEAMYEHLYPIQKGKENFRRWILEDS